MNTSNSDRNVVVTGMGVVSPIGNGLDAFWNSLECGKSGVRVREEFADSDLPLRFHSPVTGFDGKRWVRPRKALKVMCEPIQFGYAAAQMAVDQAGIADGNVDPEKFGTVFGSETFFSHPSNVADVFSECMEHGRYVHDKWGEASMRQIEPLWMLKYLPNMVASHVSIAVDAQGPSNTICQREVSALLALIEGQDWIRRGLCDAVVAGGTGCCTSLTVNLYHGIDLLSNSRRQASAVCRPFEKNRDGTVFGEGAGVLLLESEDHARRRGANVLCKISATTRSFGSPTEKDFATALADNLGSTLSDCKLSVKELGHVNAHAIGSPKWDALEATAINDVLPNVPTTALKSYFGYLGAGSAIIELIGSILALQHQRLPATLNYQDSDPDCPCRVVDKTIEIDTMTAIKLAYSIHGQIASVAISR